MDCELRNGEGEARIEPEAREGEGEVGSGPEPCGMMNCTGDACIADGAAGCSADVAPKEALAVEVPTAGALAVEALVAEVLTVEVLTKEALMPRLLTLRLLMLRLLTKRLRVVLGGLGAKVAHLPPLLAGRLGCK